MSQCCTWFCVLESQKPSKKEVKFEIIKSYEEFIINQNSIVNYIRINRVEIFNYRIVIHYHYIYTYISEKYKSIIHFALQYLENLSLTRHLSNHYNHISIQRCHLFPKNFSFNENGVQFDTICFPSFLCLWQKISLKFSPLIIVHACVWSDHLSSENRPYLN